MAIWSELGDYQRFGRSEQAVRHAGTRHHRRLLRQASRQRLAGPPGSWDTSLGPLWGSEFSARAQAPDHAYYASVKAHHDGKLAALAMSRKLVRRCDHMLRSVDPEEVYAIP